MFVPGEAVHETTRILGNNIQRELGTILKETQSFEFIHPYHLIS